ncbi:MAG: DUF4276 family protein [Desulfitobacteriaceae bacterium]
MARLKMIVEGQTEETSVRDVLAPHLGAVGVYVSVRCVETGRNKSLISRGGLSKYEKAKNDIVRWLKQDTQAFLTTMFDFYRLPENFPGKKNLGMNLDPYMKVTLLERDYATDIDNSRFLPYIQLHEFEALFFSDIEKLKVFFIDRHSAIDSLKFEIRAYPSPEHINEGKATAPSKRIAA